MQNLHGHAERALPLNCSGKFIFNRIQPGISTCALLTGVYWEKQYQICGSQARPQRKTKYLFMMKVSCGSTPQLCSSAAPRTAGLSFSRVSLPRRSLTPRPLVVADARASVPVTFKVGPKKVDNGGHVSVVGSVKELGSWDVAQAPRLSQNGGDVWQGTLPLPLGQEVEFKFVVAGSQQEAVWEGIPNRTLKPESPLALTAQWDHTDLEWKKVAGEITRLPEEDVPAKTPFDDSARRNLKATLSRLVKDALAAQA